MNTRILSLTHKLNNTQHGQAEFKRTWRWNDVLDKREYGWKLFRSWGCDFGSLTFRSVLPTHTEGHGDPTMAWTEIDGLIYHV